MLQKLSSVCDLVIVVGGKNSSNTKKLFEISSKHTTTLHVENVEELINELSKPEVSWIFKESSEKVVRIGLISGTSTDSKDVDDIFIIFFKTTVGGNFAWRI